MPASIAEVTKTYSRMRLPCEVIIEILKVFSKEAILFQKLLLLSIIIMNKSGPRKTIDNS